MQLLITVFLSMAFCSVALILIKRAAIARVILDHPNHRSLHQSPTPRIGGIGIVIGLILTAVLQQIFLQPLPLRTIVLLTAYVTLFLVSVLDDLFRLSVKIRLQFHLLVVVAWLYTELALNSQYYFLLFFCLIIGTVWAMNLYNFMDGADGLAGSMTICAFSSYAIACFAAQDWHLLFVCCAVLGSVLGFLAFNWPPAKVFLGDSGSIPVGFIAAAIGISGTLKNNWPITFPLMLFAMFWVDATFTLIKRCINRERVWESHHQHWYQLAIRGGNSHRKVLFIHLGCNVCASFMALAALWQDAFLSIAFQGTTMLLCIGLACIFGTWAEQQFRTTLNK
jgi:UDP-GlcNAc:undecaprenyl-phosphate/decaprenyl-phosphate GlcNAc-1-phosphate transferase